MTKEQEVELIKKLDKKTLDIMMNKSSDYANEDVLSNFKEVSSVVKILNIDTRTPEGYAMLMIVLKLSRINNLKKDNKDPKNESLLDSYEDMINYAKLSYLCEYENK
jgi:hypothetical protein